MSNTEALRIQLDTVHLEKQQLKVENTRLREGNSEEVKLLDTEEALAQEKAEVARLKAEVKEVETMLVQEKAEVERLNAKVERTLQLHQQAVEDRLQEQQTSRRTGTAVEGSLTDRTSLPGAANETTRREP